MSDDVQRALGRLEAAVASQGSKLDKVEAKVDRICSTVDQAKGGWKALMGAGAIGGAVVGVLMKLSAMIWVGGPR